MICFAIITSCILGAIIGFILGADYYQSHHCNAFIKDDNKRNESEEKEKEKTTNWKLDPTALKVFDLYFLLAADPYIYHCASDEAKKKMNEILKGKQPKRIRAESDEASMKGLERLKKRYEHSLLSEEEKEKRVNDFVEKYMKNEGNATIQR